MDGGRRSKRLNPDLCCNIIQGRQRVSEREIERDIQRERDRENMEFGRESERERVQITNEVS